MFTIGDIVEFGHYPQNISGCSEPIQWIVADKDKNGNNLLLISRYCIDSKRYNNYDTNIEWGDCSLRSWLNYDFYDVAFSTTEKNHIIETYVDNYEYANYGGHVTIDKVFILNID